MGANGGANSWTLNGPSIRSLVGFCKGSGKESSCNVPGKDCGKDSGRDSGVVSS